MIWVVLPSLINTQYLQLFTQFFNSRLLLFTVTSQLYVFNQHWSQLTPCYCMISVLEMALACIYAHHEYNVLDVICVYVRDFGPIVCTFANFFCELMWLKRIMKEFFGGLCVVCSFLQFYLFQNLLWRKNNPPTETTGEILAHIVNILESPLCCCYNPFSGWNLHPYSVITERNPLRHNWNPLVLYFI